MTEQEELARLIAFSVGYDREDLPVDVLTDYMQTAADVMTAGFRKAQP